MPLQPASRLGSYEILAPLGAGGLMINGRDDFLVPYEASQRPFFEPIGTGPEHKRHARLPGGHIPSDPRDIMREVLDWPDRYLGPVGTSGSRGAAAR